MSKYTIEQDISHAYKDWLGSEDARQVLLHNNKVDAMKDTWEIAFRAGMKYEKERIGYPHG